MAPSAHTLDSDTTDAAEIPEGYHVYLGADAAGSNSHDHDSWYWEPTDYEGGGGAFSSPCATRAEAVEEAWDHDAESS